MDYHFFNSRRFERKQLKMATEVLASNFKELLSKDFDFIKSVTELGHTISRVLEFKKGLIVHQYAPSASNGIQLLFQSSLIDPATDRMRNVPNVVIVEPGFGYQFDIDPNLDSFMADSGAPVQAYLVQINLSDKTKKGLKQIYWLVNDSDQFRSTTEYAEILDFIRNKYSDTPTATLQKVPGMTRASSQEAPGINVVFLGGSGYGLTDGSKLKLSLSDRSIDLVDLETRSALSIQLEYIQGLELDGGVFQKGGGFMGGGFGIGGFVIGAASASILNKVTTRTNIQTMLRITTSLGELNLFTDEATPDQLDLAFADVRTAIRNRIQTPVVGSSGISKVEQLEKLVKLRDQGILTSEEFDAEKAKILNT
jgi:hypothetical protein